MTRKIKSDYPEYRNVTHLCKVFSLQLRQNGKDTEEVTEQFLLFEARNRGQTEVLRPLMADLKQRFLN